MIGTLELTRASLADREVMVDMMNCAKRKMLKNGIHQWSSQYPNAAIIQEDIQKGDLYLLKNEENAIVCMGTFTHDPIPGLQRKASRNIWYIKRLIAAEKESGKGIGARWAKCCMEQIAVREDRIYSCTNNSNIPMQRVFEKLGFEMVYTFMVTDRKEMGDFYLYYKEVIDIE